MLACQCAAGLLTATGRIENTGFNARFSNARYCWFVSSLIEGRFI